MAKFKRFDSMIIDPKLGHAHHNLTSFGMLAVDLEWLTTNPMIIINKLKNELNVSGIKYPPYYQPCHVYDIPLLNQHFEKVIKISYSAKHIFDIAKIKIIKNTGYNTDFKKLIASATSSTISLKMHQKYFLDNGIENNLTIDWGMLLHDNPEILVEKLSNFTGYPKEDFNISELLNWRKITENVLNLVNINTI